jgi:hypothetical protein
MSRIKWRHLASSYNVGAYEGGYYRNTDVWRPTRENCVMRTLSTTKLCPVCMEAVVKRFYSILGKSYSLNDFKQAFPPSQFPAPDYEYENLTELEKQQLREASKSLMKHEHKLELFQNNIPLQESE